MSLEQQMKTGKVYIEYGHSDPDDKAYETVIEMQRVRGKDLVFDYNHTRPSEHKKKQELLKQILGGMGNEIWIESPVAFSYGCNTYLGDYVYANYNLVIVDDCEVHIGNYVMFAPNVTITATGHPLAPELRRKGAQFSLPVSIGDDVWVGSNVVIMPGVTIGNNVVIGAGSVVTHDIPDNVVAFGSPCRAVREITDRDREYYRKDMKINDDWNV